MSEDSSQHAQQMYLQLDTMAGALGNILGSSPSSIELDVRNGKVLSLPKAAWRPGMRRRTLDTTAAVEPYHMQSSSSEKRHWRPRGHPSQPRGESSWIVGSVGLVLSTHCWRFNVLSPSLSFASSFSSHKHPDTMRLLHLRT